MPSTATILLAAAVALVAGGCGEAPAGDGEPGATPYGAWQLVGGTGPEGPIEPLETHPVTLTIEEGQVGGTAACNSYGGAARIDGDRLEVTELAATEMACEPAAAMELERAYLLALQRADTIGREGEELVIRGPEVELRFAAVAPVPTEALVGTEWELDTLLDGETASTPAAEATLRLDDDGTLTGHTGCRSFDGAYVVRPGEVRVTRMAMGGGQCGGAVAAQDALVSSVLGDGFRADVDGDRLAVTSGADGLVYRAAR